MCMQYNNVYIINTRIKSTEDSTKQFKTYFHCGPRGKVVYHQSVNIRNLLLRGRCPHIITHMYLKDQCFLRLTSANPEIKERAIHPHDYDISTPVDIGTILHIYTTQRDVNDTYCEK